MTQKTQRNYTESDSRKNRFDWSKTADGSKRHCSTGSARMEMKRSVMILVLALVTLFAIGIGLTTIWLVPSGSTPKPSLPVPISPDGPREYLLVRHFQVIRDASLLTRFDDEHFCVIGKGTIHRYSITDDTKEVWTLPHELAKMEPTAACYVDFPETNNPFYRTFLLAFGNSVYSVRTTPKKVSVNKLSLDIPQESRILSIAWSENNIFLADYAKGQIYQYDTANLKKTILGATSDPNGFPGFHLSKTPCFGLAYSQKEGLLFATNSAMFRVEVFNPESGLWLKDRSWGEGPWQPEGLGFTGCCNPVGLDLLNTGQIVTTEKGKDPLVRVFNTNGTQVCQVNALSETPPMDGKSWLRVAVLNDSTLVLLSPRGTAYIYECVFNPDNALPQPTVDQADQAEPTSPVVSPDQKDKTAPTRPVTPSTPAASSSDSTKETDQPKSVSAAKTNQVNSTPQMPVSPSASSPDSEKK